MRKPVVIRPMTSDDITEVANWLVTLPLMQRYQLNTEKTCAQFERALAKKDLILVADIGQTNCACGFAWSLVDGAFGRSAYLRLIGIRPDRAGMGVGSMLLADTERAAAEVSPDLFLLVSDFNKDAQRFYQNHGYQQIGAIPGYVLPDVAELIFWKRLSPIRTD